MTPELLEACRQPAGPLRPTYCNVPQWAEWLVYLAGLLAVAIFAYGIWRHRRAWLAGQPTVSRRNTAQWRRRVTLFMRYVVGQRATMARRVPAVFHTGIFWGFVLLLIGTALATIDWDVAHLIFDVRMLAGTPYLVYEAVLDTAGVAFTLALLVAMWRRYVQAPHHVVGSWDFVIWSLLFINVSGFALEALRLVMAPVPWGQYSWMGQGMANLVFLAPDTFIRDSVPVIHFWAWLAHMVVALAFIAAIPYTNAVHMVTTALNSILKSLDPNPPGAALQPIDIESAEFYGVSVAEHLTWKQRLSVDACTRCGRCETVCPAYLSGTSLNPKAVTVSLSNRLRGEVDLPAVAQDAQAADTGGTLVGDGQLVEPNALWACTTCLACVEACPAFVEIVDTIVDMRRHLALNEGELPGTAAQALRSMGTAGNPWGYSPADRLAWADGLDVCRAKPGEHYELLYWVGCSASYDARNQKIARAMVRLMNAAGLKFGVMEQERCHAESARRMGEEYLYQTAAEENIGNLTALSFDRIVCHCPHCFNTLKNEYPHFGGSFAVVHHSQLLDELIGTGQLKLNGGAGDRLAIHDSCYLGRYNGEFDAPRRAFAAAGVGLVELPRHGPDGLCCGGGGGRMWFDHPEEESAIEVLRLEEVLASGAEAVGVACPFCLTMLDSAAKSIGAEKLRILDLAEVLERSVADG